MTGKMTFLNRGAMAVALAMAAVLGAATVQGADDGRQARLKELAKIVEENSMGHGPWNRCFLKYYCPTELGKDVKACTDAEWAEMKAKCLAALKESYELDPTPGRAVAYANGLHFLGRYAEAMPLYEGAMEKLRAQKKPDAKTFGWGLLSLAECKLALGDRAATIEILKDLSARKLNFGRYGGSPSGEAAGVLPFLEERVLDYCKLPRFTDAKAFPTAQKPEYRDTFAPLGKNLAVKASGIADDDPRFGFFETKLRRLGVEVGHRGVLGAVTGLFSGDYVLEIEVRDDVADFAALKPFQRREAYVLETAKDGAKLTAETKQGVLWGLVTFVQMTDPKQVRVREGRVVDWPATAERGFLATECWPGCFEYSLMCKFNNVNFQGNPVRSGGFTPLRWLVNEQMAKCYVSYGLTVYFGICDLTMAPNLPITQPRTLQIQADTCRRYAKVGAGVYYPYDDCRYPMNPQDKEATGNLARTIDADHIQKLYETVAKDYPDFKLIFCPPFYWGPDSNSDGYSEDREEYLKTLRKLDPKIDLYWTGPMVKSFDMTKRQVKWFTDLTGHKPSIFQNGMDVHRFLTNMLTDDFDFAGWHYPEFYEDISLFHANSHMNLDAARDTSVAEGLWNPVAYEPLAAARNGTDMLLGEKVFETLRPGRDALAYFDKYPRDNNLSVDILSEKPAELQAKIDLARDCWKRAKEMHPDIGGSHYVPLISWCERIVQAAKNPPDTLTRYKQDIEQVERQAKEEVGVDKAKGDLLYTPASVNGGQFFVYAAFDPGSARAGATKAFEHPIPKRLVRCLRGKGVTGRNATGFHFECDPFPPTGDYEMYVNGMDDETPRQNVLRVTVNDKVIYEQAPGFSDNTGYSVKKIVIPFAAMKRHNDVVIQNVTPGSNPNGTPWMMINYIVLKKAAAKAKIPMARTGDRTDTVLTCGWTADGAPVTLPHTWNVPDGEDGPTADGAPEGVYRPGRGWTARPSKDRFDKEQKDTQQSVRSLGYARKCVTYRHDLPDPDPVRRYFVRCEAAGTHATVVVNGRVAGRHENAFTGFTFEITGAMRKAKNVLEIVVDNFYDQQGLPITADYTMFGGLYRPVHLIVTPAACFDIAGEGYGPGVTVRADAKTGRVRVEPQVLRPSGKTKVKVSYAVPEAGVTSEANEFAVPGFALWSPESPKLYHLTATLTSEWGTDVVTVPFGFRTAEFREDGFYLNGQKRKLRGVNWHQDFQGKGWAVSHEDIALSARLIKDMGADAVRTAHYPHAQDAYDLCDELGLVAWCELPVTDMTSTGAVSRARARAAVREMTAQYGHHPSIAMWSVSNEVWERGPEGGSKGTIDVHRELDAAFRHDDPTRPTVLASCYPDQTNVNRITTAFGYNTYPGWYFGKPEQISDLLAELVRKNGLTTFALSEYGGGANPGQHENPAPERCRKPNSPWHPEEYQTRHHVVHYREVKRNPRIWGSYVWQMFDSAADSTQSGPIEGINDKGLVTRDRKTLKDAYAFYRANWNPAPQLHLSGARMQSTTNATYDVLAFCNAGDVTLKVNGREIGSVTPDEVMCAEWKAVPLASGRNELEVSAKGLPPVRQVLSLDAAHRGLVRPR